jgi:hypothetical protein
MRLTILVKSLSRAHTRVKGITTIHPRVTKAWWPPWQGCGYPIFTRRFVRLWSLLGRPSRKRVCPLSLCHLDHFTGHSYVSTRAHKINAVLLGRPALTSPSAPTYLTSTFKRRSVSLWITQKIWTGEPVNPEKNSGILFSFWRFRMAIRKVLPKKGVGLMLSINVVNSF